MVFLLEVFIQDKEEGPTGQKSIVGTEELVRGSSALRLSYRQLHQFILQIKKDGIKYSFVRNDNNV